MYRTTGLKAFKHVHQDSAAQFFGSYADYYLNEVSVAYPIESISTIPVHAIMSDLDLICPSSLNADKLSLIPGITTDVLTGLDHLDLISNNTSKMRSKGTIS